MNKEQFAKIWNDTHAEINGAPGGAILVSVRTGLTLDTVRKKSVDARTHGVELRVFKAGRMKNETKELIERARAFVTIAKAEKKSPVLVATVNGTSPKDDAFTSFVKSLINEGRYEDAKFILEIMRK